MYTKLANEIQAEQDRGRQKYGNGPNDFAHDESHSHVEWLDYIRDHAIRAGQSEPQSYRKELVKTAGLCISAIESFDRRHFGSTAVAAAESDALGEAIWQRRGERLRKAAPMADPKLGEVWGDARDPLTWRYVRCVENCKNGYLVWRVAFGEPNSRGDTSAEWLRWASSPGIERIWPKEA